MAFNPKPFGPFMLLDKLAVGGMAELYLAQLAGAGGFEKLLAIKKILPTYSTNPEFVSMFIEEAKLTVQLSHTNIVQIYDFGEIGGDYYLSMEFIEGQNLRQILAKLEREKRLCPIDIACHLVAELCRGLDYAHIKTEKKTHEPLEIIHRDVSPQNIIVSYGGEVKIIDFGIAKATSKVEKTRAGVLKGKFSYMSPEHASGDAIDLRTDIFSAGIILFELLTQERLFASDSEVNTIKKIQKCKIPRPSAYNSAIPPELEEIVLKALAKDRSTRYQTAREFQRELTHFIYKFNPHFLSHDLADFMKELFKDEIESWKIRVREVQDIAGRAGVRLSRSAHRIERRRDGGIPTIKHKKEKPSGESTIVESRKTVMRQQTRIAKHREVTKLGETDEEVTETEFRIKRPNFVQRALTLGFVAILGFILLYSILVFIEGPSPERSIATPEEQPKIEPEPEKEKAPEEEKKEEDSPEPPIINPKDIPDLESTQPKQISRQAKQIVRHHNFINPALIEPGNRRGYSQLRPNMITGVLYVDGKLITIPTEQIELEPGEHHIRYLDPALSVFGEKSITIAPGKTIEISKNDFSLRPLESAGNR